MATLEKIRSKSVLLVSVIFVALFLFIITIVDNPLGLFQDQTSVARVKGEKINYEQYQQRANQMRETNPEAEGTDTQALESLIMESLFNQELGKLGIVVTDRELSDALVGDNASQMVTYQFRQRFGSSPEEFFQAMSNPDAYGIQPEQAEAMRAEWISFENNVEQMLLGQKLYSLLTGTIRANKIDAKAMQDEGATTYTILAASKNVFSVTDSLTDADAKQYYADHRAQYRIDEPSRYVRFVNLDVRPSSADQAAAVSASTKALRDLNDQPAMEGLAGNSTFTVSMATAAADDLDRLNQPQLKTFLTNPETEVGKASIITNTAYAMKDPQIVIAKLLGKENRVNGATIKQVAIDPTFAPDTVIAQLNAGVADVKGLVGEAQSAPIKFSQLPAEVADTLLSIGTGRYIALGGANSAIAVAVESYDAPVDVYDYATATYVVEPSKTTVDGLRDRMRAFLEVASSAAAFNEENAAVNGLVINDALVTPSSAAVGRLADSRGLVAWAMDADKGAVSPMNQDSRNSRISAVAVVDIYDNEYVPLSFPQVRSEVELQALNQKRANSLIAEYQGKGNTVAEYAAAMGVSADTISNVNFSGNSASRFSPLAAMRAHKTGDVVGPVRWNTNVVVYEILDAKESEMPYDEAANMTNFSNRMQSLVLGDMRSLLLGNGKVENRILRFTRQ
ncbi:MAG: SurA N-terminal domain-containing protein [Muribaculaceae bacterium]|nr:SurA N-terminal domain-containing protein [Muribaculaceae bacterium]MDE6462582.1 SurA N-terminal domain-containing protein [Muribaculaceae bacterium]